jgi:peptide-methionine (S)-S-oxide reductase
VVSIGFGGGCHWCTEAVFQPLVGVNKVRQGFIRSDAPDDTWSEAVEVSFDPARISLRDLITVHLITHASEADHKMRGKYRSAVYTADDGLAVDSRNLIAELALGTDAKFVTRVLKHRGFKPSDARFHNYYKSNPERPFCRAYIEPKLAKLRARHNALLNKECATS